MGTKMLVERPILSIIHFLVSLCTLIYYFLNKLKISLSPRHHKRFGCSSAHDAKTLNKLPTHVGIVIVEEEICYSDIAKMTWWCIGLGASYITIYDSRGLCKQNIDCIQEEFVIQKKKLSLERTFDRFTIHLQSGIQASTQVPSGSNAVPIRVLSMCDGRQQLISLSRDMSLAVSRNSMKLSDIEPVTVNHLLLERTHFPDIDLVLRFGATHCLMGLAPWQIRLTEFLSLPSHKNIDYASFLGLFQSYSNAEQRFGK